MATAAKLVRMKPVIEPELKAFLDEVLVPMLVADALRDVANENALALAPYPVAHSPATSFRGAGEMV
jgi:hypothetical protein